MDYKVVNCKAKKAAGISTRTNNNSPEMADKIGALWQNFFGSGIFQSINNKVNSHTLGLYYNYESDDNGDYTMSTCCEISDENNQPEGVEIIHIPEGKYAKFELKGPMDTIISDFWKEFWTMDINRAYTFDYEEYLNSDPQNCEVNIYIALK